MPYECNNSSFCANVKHQNCVDAGVGLDTMVKFNRLRELSADFVVIAAALRKSPSGLMEVEVYLLLLFICVVEL